MYSSKKIFLILLTFFCSLKVSSAQTRLGILVGGGTTWYYGDMNDRLTTHPKLFRYYMNAGLLYRVSDNVDVVGNFFYGKIVGADSLAIQQYNLTRNLNFHSTITEVSLLANFKFLGYNGKNHRQFNPYLIGGIGYFHFDPHGQKNGMDVALQPLGTEGQYINGGGYPKPYKLYQLSVPLGIGVEIPLSKAFAVRLEIINHYTFTDYLDDVSGKYADSTKLAATPNGALATTMASNIQLGYPVEGRGRGNPKRKDSFAQFGISILWTPVSHSSSEGKNSPHHRGRKSKKKATCPAYG